MSEESQTVWTVQLLTKVDKEFKAIAKHRGQTRAGVLRQWVRKSYAALPDEAKKDQSKL